MLTRSDSGIVFMLHRFADPEFPHIAGHDSAAIRSMIGYLRRHRFDLVPLSTLFERARNHEPLNGAIAFTIDDGYRDHAAIGARLFAEFDCPVTTFATTGFLDGSIWFWWDKIDFVFSSTARQSLDVPGVGPAGAVTLRWQTPQERDAARDIFTAACKRMSDAEKHDAISRIAQTAEVALPTRAPAAYAPMSWSEARACEQSGMTFGPHTVTHPILANVPDEQSQFEITESWRRLSAEVVNPVPVFCYPNGDPDRDFGARETATIDAIGLFGAVIGNSGYVTGNDLRDRSDRFYVHRFPMPDTRVDLIQWVTGLEAVKRRIRGRRR